MEVKYITIPIKTEQNVFGQGKPHKPDSNRVDKTRIQMRKSETRKNIASAHKDEYVRTTPRSPERLAKITQRKKEANKQRFIAFISALGLTASVSAGINAISSLNSNKKDNDPSFSIVEKNFESNNLSQNQYTIETEPTEHKSDEAERLEQERLERERLEQERLEQERLEQERLEQEEKQKQLEQRRLEKERIEQERLELEKLEMARLEKIDYLNKILEENPDIKEAYDNLSSAVATFSKHMGQNGYELIDKYIEELGDGKVDKTDVYKILFIESGGRVYDKNGNILKSTGDAYGPFQIKECAQIDMNKYFGTNYDVKKPEDNLAVNVLLLRWLYNQKSNQLASGKVLPTGSNLKHAIMWGYHDGAYANKLSYYGKAYLNEYDRLSKLDQYPELYDLMAGKFDEPITAIIIPYPSESENNDIYVVQADDYFPEEHVS